MGRSVVWSVTIAEQRSVTPDTSVAPPAIAEVSLEDGGTYARTSGGQTVLIAGTNFGTTLRDGDLVSFGRSGQELRPECAVRIPHAVIACELPASTGQDLRWMVTVGEQSSTLSAHAVTSYAAPVISRISPAAPPTHGVSHAVGTNFVRPHTHACFGGTVLDALDEHAHAYRWRLFRSKRQSTGWRIVHLVPSYCASVNGPSSHDFGHAPVIESVEVSESHTPTGGVTARSLVLDIAGATGRPPRVRPTASGSR